MRVLFFSEYNRTNWGFKEMIRAKGAQVIWVKTETGYKSLDPHEPVNLAVIDIEKFSLEMLSSIGFGTPIILLADSDESIYAEIEDIPQLMVFKKDKTPADLIATIQKICGMPVVEREQPSFQSGWIKRALPFFQRAWFSFSILAGAAASW
ncbi:MAG: hypothetical protein ABL958_16950 [Bdellovibrionia bacterium]